MGSLTLICTTSLSLLIRVGFLAEKCRYDIMREQLFHKEKRVARARQGCCLTVCGDTRRAARCMMAVQAVTLHLPSPLYERLKERAEQTHRSVEAELLEVVAAAVPAAISPQRRRPRWSSCISNVSDKG
jgi:Arc-like DNA binding domain